MVSSLVRDEDGEPLYFVRELARAIEDVREWSSMVRNNYRKNDTLFWNELYVAPVHDGAGRLTNFVGIQKDVTEQKALQQELAYRATHDMLTDLPNGRCSWTVSRRPSPEPDGARGPWRCCSWTSTASKP